MINAQNDLVLNGVAQSAFYVAPIRSATVTNLLGYNTTNKEIAYTETTVSDSGNLNIRNIMLNHSSSSTLANISFPSTIPTSNTNISGFGITWNDTTAWVDSGGGGGGGGKTNLIGYGGSEGGGFTFTCVGNTIIDSSYVPVITNFKIEPTSITSTVAIYTPTFFTTSDYRIKEGVHQIPTYPNIDNLNPVTYTNTITGIHDMGFIAHEVQEHFPFLVSGEKDGTVNQSLNYIGLIALLTKEIQQLKHRVLILEKRENTT